MRVSLPIREDIIHSPGLGYDTVQMGGLPDFRRLRSELLPAHLPSLLSIVLILGLACTYTYIYLNREPMIGSGLQLKPCPGCGHPEMLVNSASVTWKSANDTLIFPCNVEVEPVWCPYWMGESVLSVMITNDTATLRSEIYSLSLNNSHLEHILLNWNESYYIPILEIQERTVAIPPRDCMGSMNIDEFAWRGSELILSDRLREVVLQNVTRGLQPHIRYSRLVLIGTSETRRLFGEMCRVQQLTPDRKLEPKTTFAECGPIKFVSNVGCSFTDAIDKMNLTSRSTFISASCGLHGEYLDNINHWNMTLTSIKDWALAYQQRTKNAFQFRTSNAVNPLNTKPPHLALARNNIRSQKWSDMCQQVFGRDNISIFDVYLFTKTIFWTATDHVHYNTLVYSGLAQLLKQSIPVVFDK